MSFISQMAAAMRDAIIIKLWRADIGIDAIAAEVDMAPTEICLAAVRLGLPERSLRPIVREVSRPP